MKVDRTCPVCHRLFQTHPCRLLGERRGIFCSRKCKSIGRIKRQKRFSEYTCKECGVHFTRRLGYGGTGDCCSMKCRHVYFGRKRRGANHPFWKGGRARRTWRVRTIIDARIKESGKCERCGSTEYLCGHHKKKHADFPEWRESPENIEVLCRQCHAKEHPEMSWAILRPLQRSGKSIKCIVCGKERYVTPHLLKTAKFCSKICQRFILHQNLRLKHLNKKICKITS